MPCLFTTRNAIHEETVFLLVGSVSKQKSDYLSELLLIDRPYR
jgi:hypothetical protein